MILVVTNKRDYTADFLILEMKRRGLEFLRLNTEDFPQSARLSLKLSNSQIQGQLSVGMKSVAFTDIHSVWYRRPLPSIPAETVTDEAAKDFIIRESRVTLEGAWRLLSCIWVSHPDRIQVAESKIYQLQIASQIGFTIPTTLITNSPAHAQTFYEDRPDQVIFKPQRHGRIDREDRFSLLYTNVVTPDHMGDFARINLSPVLFQHYAPKKLELRVTVVGKNVFPVEIHSQDVSEAKHDWRKVDPAMLKHVPHELPPHIANKCIQLVETLGLSFGAIDLILTPDGEYIFLEINPNGQWAWIEQLCPEIRISDALIEILAE